MGEKFSVAEVAALRNELLQGGLDSFQTAEVIKTFLSRLGYGISPQSALDAVGRIEGTNCNVDVLHKELEQVGHPQYILSTILWSEQQPYPLPRIIRFVP